jgi:hypothetical protein
MTFPCTELIVSTVNSILQLIKQFYQAIVNPLLTALKNHYVLICSVPNNGLYRRFDPISHNWSIPNLKRNPHHHGRSVRGTALSNFFEPSTEWFYEYTLG